MGIKFEWRIQIGQTFKDNKRDFTIIDKEIRYENNNNRKKYYKYHCNKCGAELWMVESSILKNIGCACCSNKIVVKGINDIATTDGWMIKYFKTIEDAYIHTYNSSDKVLLKCPNCGFEKEMSIYQLHNYKFACTNCNDNIAYTEKLMGNLLKELGVNFKTQLNKKQFSWCGKYRYDFYFVKNGQEYIIETHGEQHYRDNTKFKKASGIKQQENDEIKKELALRNNIKEENYIVIDCRYSKIDFIKNNIIHSELNDIFDLININWNNIDEESQKSLVKEVCDYWYLHNDINNEGLTTTDIGEEFNLHKSTICRYLNKGNNFGWCVYNPKEEQSKGRLKNSKHTKIEIFKDNESLGVFNSVTELIDSYYDNYSIKLIWANISAVCNGRRKSYKGFTFKYVESEKVP